MSAECKLFIVVPPGFEDLARVEISEKFLAITQSSDIQTVRGGLLMVVASEIIPELHYRLKLATSIRERLYEFKCRDFPKLFNKIQSLSWRDHLIGDAFEISVTAEKSRLNNEKRIAETVTDGIQRYFSKQPPKKPRVAYAHKIYVRFENDVCTISRDLSGAPLFQRGYKELSAVAPIRENLAAGLFYSLFRASGGFATLIDPMCGSGTLLLEASQFWRPRDRHAQMQGGDYAFLHDARWAAAHLNECGDIGGPVASSGGPSRFFGFDFDEQALQSAQKSLLNLHGTRIANNKAWSFSRLDIMTAESQSVDVELGRSAIILNPPYGERIRLPVPPAQYYPQLLNRLATFELTGTSQDIEAIGIVIPKAYVRHMPSHQGVFRRTQVLDFQNGGIDVQFQIFLAEHSL